MASRWKVKAGRLAALAVMTAAAASCAPKAAEEPAPPKAAASREGSALTSFLAGRFAHAQGDTATAADYYLRALRHDPDNAELLQRGFGLLVAEGRFDEAVPLARRILTFDADSPIALLVAGIADARDGRFAEAEARFAALPRKGVNAFLAPLLTAWSRAGQDRADAAVEALAPLADSPGTKGLHAFHAGLISDIAGKAGAAETHYQTALAGQISIRAIEAAGTFYQRAGKPDKARELYERYRSEHPETMLFDGARLLAEGTGVARAVPDARAGLAQALFDTASVLRQSSAADLAMMFTRLSLALEPNSPLARMTVGDILTAQERLAEANAAFAAIDPASPAHAYGRMRIALNLDAMGDTEAALKTLDTLAAAQPKGIDALVAKGDLLRRHKRFAEAAVAYEAARARVTTVEQRHWLLFFSLGIAHERSGQWPKAEAEFKRSLELRPDQPDVLNYLGYSWVDQGINLEEGRKLIEKAVALAPRDGAIVDSLGWALYRLGDFAGAVRQLERAVELKPEDPTINDHLGDAYWQVGRVGEAMIQWKRALSLDPEPEQIAPLEEKIRSGQVPAKPLAQ